MRFLVTLLLFQMCNGLSFAQDHEYIQYTAKDGLPTNYVYGVIEDDDGHIWAYTENGMSKFDGYSFQNYSTRDGMPGNDVVYCIKDVSGKIWLHTYRNKPAYLFQDSFHIVYDEVGIPIEIDAEKVYYSCRDYTLKSFQEDRMVSILTYELDSLILAKEAAFLQLDSVLVLPVDWDENRDLPYRSTYFHVTNDSIYHYSQSVEVLMPLLGANFENSYFYYSKFTGMVYWKDKEEVKSFYGGQFDFHRSFAQFYDLGKKEKYLVRFGMSDLMIFDVRKETGKRISIENYLDSPQSDIQVTVLDSTFLLGMDQGFLEFDFSMNLVDKMISTDLSDNYRLLRSYKDSRGNVWLGSREGGLFFFPKQKRKTSSITSEYAKDKAFEQLIPTENGKLLGITDNSGIYLIENDAIVNVVPPNMESRFRSAAQTPYGIIVSHSSGAFVLKNKDKQFSKSPYEKTFTIVAKKQFDLPGIDALIKLENRHSMVYTPKETSLYSSFGMGLTNHDFLLGQNAKMSWIPLRMSTLFYNSFQNEIYGGNADGLFRIAAETAIPFLKQYKELKNITSLYASSEKLWIGTESNGLFVYRFSDEQLSKISDGLMIRRIRKGVDNTLLIATNEGLALVNDMESIDPKIRRYTIHDGLPSNEIQDVFPAGDGYIYVATTDGIHKLDNSIIDNTSLSASDLQISNIYVNKKATQRTDLLELSYQENTLDIHFNLLSYASNGKISYYTKLSPFQTEWNESDNRNVNYFSLPPDEYTFHLKAKDVFGNEVTLMPMEINVQEAFWQSLLFKVLMVGLFLGGLFFLINKRDRSKSQMLEKEKDMSRRMAALELTALKAQMNPHFVFNALGAIQYFIQTNDVEAADNYLTRFARLMRKYLDSSKEKMISLKDEVDLLSIYSELEKLRFEDLFSVEIMVDKGIQVEDCFVPTMIIQPFVENAINHGLNGRRDKKGLLQIHFSQNGKKLFCEISDNGIGHKNAAKNKRKGHQSKGLSIIEEKIETLKKSGLMVVTVKTENLDSGSSEFPGTIVSLMFQSIEDEL